MEKFTLVALTLLALLFGWWFGQNLRDDKRPHQSPRFRRVRVLRRVFLHRMRAWLRRPRSPRR
jgi:hypothetical protein